MLLTEDWPGFLAVGNLVYQILCYKRPGVVFVSGTLLMTQMRGANPALCSQVLFDSNRNWV